MFNISMFNKINIHVHTCILQTCIFIELHVLYVYLLNIDKWLLRCLQKCLVKSINFIHVYTIYLLQGHELRGIQRWHGPQWPEAPVMLPLDGCRGCLSHGPSVVGSKQSRTVPRKCPRTCGVASMSCMRLRIHTYSRHEYIIVFWHTRI